MSFFGEPNHFAAKQIMRGSSSIICSGMNWSLVPQNHPRIGMHSMSKTRALNPSGACGVLFLLDFI